jgi:hypothetical protein
MGSALISGLLGQKDDPNIVQRPVTADQAASSFQNTQQALAQQQAFLQALQGQNGIQNQSNVYNQLQGVAAGTGPNPAAATLANATGANVANQAALMASQRGAGANPGLIARQAALAGGNIQQQAAGQGAALQAQQSLNAINSAGGIAGQQVQNQAGALQNYGHTALGQQSNIIGGVNAGNTAAVANQGSLNQTNPVAGVIGGVASGAGAAAAMASGGEVESSEGLDHIDSFIHGAVMMAAGGAMVPGKASVKGDSLKNDKVPAILSPGEIVIPRSIAQGEDAPKKAAQFVQAILAKKGGGLKK